MPLLAWWLLLLSSLSCTAIARTTATHSARNPNGSPSLFVTKTPDGKLMFNGSELRLIGTTAYWLASLNSNEDIDMTLANISANGFNAVRTWAFNDVETVPDNGTWFQLIQNGTTSINEGPNGLQKLDQVVDLAQKHGIFVILSLTNNWNPQTLADGVPAADIVGPTNNSRPRNTLSNDYGGMDLYVRQFGGPQHHDQFFTNQTIIDAFKNYTTQIVKRYANRSNVLSWELANDPRCNSTLATSVGCQAQNVTRWHADIGDHVKQQDPNHLVSTGHQGFLCTGCPKLFPRIPPPPPPQPSPAPGSRRRSTNGAPLTAKRILLERKEALKRTRALAKKSSQDTGIRIRGRWVSTPTRRQQDSGLGSAFDGSQGVDSEDIMGIPSIDVGSFSLLPDQNSYGTNDPNLDPFNNTVQQGLAWIRQHADLGNLFGSPMMMTSFGLVTQGNAQAFVPVNSTEAPFAPDASGTVASGTEAQQPFGVTDEQRDDAYSQWLQAGVLGGIQGMIQYQWSQPGLSVQQGSIVPTPDTQTGTTPATTNTGTTPVAVDTGTSPNDGYGIQGAGRDPLIQSIQAATQGFAAEASLA